MRRFVIAAVLLLASLGAQAQETVFYKCTDAKGNVSMQNGVPCAAGMKQEVKRIGEVRTVPVPAKKPAVAEAPEAKPEYGEFVMVRGPRSEARARARSRRLAGATGAVPVPHLGKQGLPWRDRHPGTHLRRATGHRHRRQRRAGHGPRLRDEVRHLHRDPPPSNCARPGIATWTMPNSS
jgi:hypothetical protein